MSKRLLGFLVLPLAVGHWQSSWAQTTVTKTDLQAWYEKCLEEAKEDASKKQSCHSQFLNRMPDSNSTDKTTCRQTINDRKTAIESILSYCPDQEMDKRLGRDLVKECIEANNKKSLKERKTGFDNDEKKDLRSQVSDLETSLDDLQKQVIEETNKHNEKQQRIKDEIRKAQQQMSEDQRAIDKEIQENRKNFDAQTIDINKQVSALQKKLREDQTKAMLIEPNKAQKIQAVVAQCVAQAKKLKQVKSSNQMFKKTACTEADGAFMAALQAIENEAYGDKQALQGDLDDTNNSLVQLLNELKSNQDDFNTTAERSNKEKIEKQLFTMQEIQAKQLESLQENQTFAALISKLQSDIARKQGEYHALKSQSMALNDSIKAAAARGIIPSSSADFYSNKVEKITEAYSKFQGAQGSLMTGICSGVSDAKKDVDEAQNSDAIN